MIKVRAVLLAGLISAGLLGTGLNPVQAQTPAPAAVQPSAPSAASPWSGYGPTYPWGGYFPGQPWSGYGPAPAVPPGSAWAGYAPGTAWGGYVPAPPGAGAVVAPQVVTRPAPRDGRIHYNIRRTTPAQYREYGTGRAMFMHKPWLPGQ